MTIKEQRKKIHGRPVMEVYREKLTGELYKPKAKIFIDVPGRVFAKVYCRLCDNRLNEKDNYCTRCGIKFDWSDLIES